MATNLAARHNQLVESLELKGLRRHLSARSDAQGPEITLEGKTLANFSSNDYLGLAAHPRITGRITEEISRHGFGAGGAALLSGRSDLHAELEDSLARFAGAPSALLFSSGYLANVGALQALIQRKDIVHHDRLNHASLIDGVLASGAKHYRYSHGAIPIIEDHQHTAANAGWLVTESLFSMDGDYAPLAELYDLANQKELDFYIDDAHGFAISPTDHPYPRTQDRAGQVRSGQWPDNLVVMVTLGKALGGQGAAILATEATRDFLINNARTFIYDTALPPVCAAGALEALEVIREFPELKHRLFSNVAAFRHSAEQAGLQLTSAPSAIQPIMIGDDQKALKVSQALERAGFYAKAIRPPTVPVGSARLRITLTAAHTQVQIDSLTSAIRDAMDGQ